MNVKKKDQMYVYSFICERLMAAMNFNMLSVTLIYNKGLLSESSVRNLSRWAVKRWQHMPSLPNCNNSKPGSDMHSDKYD